MVERAEREATMDEIVVALRESRRAGRTPSFAVVSHPASRSSGTARRSGKGRAARDHDGAADVQNATAGTTEIADLRDSEIERLLTENARLNARVAYFLKLIEREQARNAEQAAVRRDDDALVRTVVAALEHKLRPMLLVLLRMVEKQHPAPASRVATPALNSRAAPAAPDDPNWIVDLDAAHS
jgi:hypothetical protein